MKCMYYLASTLKTTEDVADDLHQVGVKDYYLHVVSKDESGLKQHAIRSSNYLETRDIIRDGFIGAALGFIVGLIGIGLLMYFQPFGPTVQVPNYVYVMLLCAATLFGAWEGGLTGIDSENRKISKFHDDIAAGRYLLLVYVRKHQEETVRKMMQAKHPDAKLAAIDTHFVNPFTDVTKTPETPVS